MISAAIGAKLGSGGSGVAEWKKISGGGAWRRQVRSIFKEKGTGGDRKGGVDLGEQDRDDCNLKVAWTEGEMVAGR